MAVEAGWVLSGLGCDGQEGQGWSALWWEALVRDGSRAEVGRVKRGYGLHREGRKATEW